MIEREVKLEAPADFELPDLRALRNQGIVVEDGGTKLLDATYWDTDSLDLYRSHIGLRHRTTDGARGTWTIKGESAIEGDVLAREEIELPGEPDQLPAELLPGRLPQIDGRALHPAARVRTRRHVIKLLDTAGRQWAELADDSVEVLEGARVVSAFREIEVEAVDGGDEQRIGAVVALLRSAGAGAPAALAKYQRALAALGRVPLS